MFDDIDFVGIFAARKRISGTLFEILRTDRKRKKLLEIHQEFLSLQPQRQRKKLAGSS
jgi:hypothetical protein